MPLLEAVSDGGRISINVSEANKREAVVSIGPNKGRSIYTGLILIACVRATVGPHWTLGVSSLHGQPS